MRSLAGQAAVAVENNLLYESIERLFEGFVTAAVSAIEQRDPTTSGHSFRVADLTVELARVIDRLDSGIYSRRSGSTPTRSARSATRRCCTTSARSACASRCWSRRRSSIRCSSKAIRARFEFVMKSIESESNRRKLEHLLKHGRDGYDGFAAKSTPRRAAQIAQAAEGLRVRGAVERADGPAGGRLPVPAAAGGARVPRSPRRRAACCCSRKRRASSRSARGTSTPAERGEIESHVTHTFEFLSEDPLDEGPLAASPTSPTRTTRSSTAAAIRASSSPPTSRCSRG